MGRDSLQPGFSSTEGSPIEDPLKFSKQIANLMAQTNA